MTWLRVFWSRARAMMRSHQRDQDLRREIDSHLDEAAEEYRRRGLSAAEARRAARVSFGGVAQAEDAYREHLSFSWLEHVRRDARHAVRALRRSPGFSLVVLVVLALGTGAATAVFVLLNSIVLRPLPFPQSDRLVVIRHSAPGLDRADVGVSSGLYFHYRDHAQSFESLGTYTERVRNLRLGDRTERVRMADVGSAVFHVLGVRPALGRLFTEEDGRLGFMSLKWKIPIVLSHAFWVDRFGADPNIIGRVLTIPDSPREVVGVMPAGFAFPNADTQIWMLLEPSRTSAALSNLGLDAVGRLRPGATAVSAQAELTRVLPQIQGLFKDTTAEKMAGVRLAPIVMPLKFAVVGDVAQVLWILFGGMTLLLVIACANAASLFLVRAEHRRREIAVRQALGAHAGQIARLFFVEALLLTAAAAAFGLLVAKGLVSGVIALVPVALPRTTEIAIDWIPIAFAAGVAGLMTMVYGTLSVRRQRHSLTENLSSGGPRATDHVSRRWVRDPLIVVQAALALTLMTGSALMVKTYRNLSTRELGFSSDGLLTVEIGLPGSKARQHIQIYQQLVERIRHLPGVESAAAASFAPLGGSEHMFPVEAGSTPIAFKFFTPGYFQTMRIAMVQGESFATPEPVPPYPVLVSAALARRLDAAPRVVGTSIRRLEEDGRIPDVRGPVPPFTIAGVVGDVRELTLRDEPTEIVYIPLIEPPVELSIVPTSMTLVVRAQVPPLGLADAVKDTIAAIEPTLSVGRIQTMDAIIRAARSNETFVGVLLLLAAAVSLFLGVVGIYGGVAQVVRHRTREIGIRLALGARRTEIVWMVAAGALSAVVAGAFLGLVAVLAGTRILSALLFGVAPRDPASILLVTGILFGSSVVAALLAARQATRVAPLLAMRGE
ncbi:MAG TPA: ADOP family duplicated permease [Vicinamibacterales bacterium]|nr:ADOP family duplicated permease [Vicinamibacterales bacterium]